MIRAKFTMFHMDQDRELPISDDHFLQLFVPKKLQEHEPGLYQSKWFDYRRMTPVQATCAYIKAFAEMYRVIYARELDYQRAKHVQPPTVTGMMADLENGVAKAKRKLSGFWRGRQVADAIGMPYDLYIEHAFTFRMRRWQRAYLPQPEHLYHEFDVEKIVEKWEELQQSQLYLPEDPAFLARNYRDIPYQNDFHEWVFKQAQMRDDEGWVLAQMIEQDLIPIDKVCNRVESRVYERIESFLQ